MSVSRRVRATGGASAALTLTERVDLGALGYVIENFAEYRWRPETDAGEAYAQITKYRASASSDGTRQVRYHRAAHNRGRLFAERSLSLQSMPREIRNAVAWQLYEDVDFQNCQPTLLLQYCERHGLPCPALRRYCAERETVLAELEGDGRRKGAGKTAVLAVMNGGSASERHRGVSETPWLRAYEEEMRRIQESALETAQGAPYLEIARGGGRGSRRGNVLGSAMSLLLGDLENDALMALREFMESEAVGRKVGVLVFDGCMVDKTTGHGPLTREVLDEASEYIYARTGYRMRLVVKDMSADRLPVPDAVYNGPSSLRRAPRYAGDDEAAATHFLADVSPIARSCMGRVYVRVNGAWLRNKELVDKVLLARCLSANIQYISEQGDVRKMSSNVTAAKRIVTAALALLPDDPAFEEAMWRSVLGVLCFRDGLWDFRRRRFFAYEERPEVMPAVVIPRDFPRQRPAPEALAEVRERVLLSALGSEDKVRTLLELKARAMAGEYTDKQWAAMLGERNCGKGVLQELDQATFGGYVNTINANGFLMQAHAAQDAAKSMSWALDCEHCRLTYTNEVRMDAGSRSVRLDGNLLKAFQSGGDTLYARKNYMDERAFKVATKLVMNLNDIPEVTPKDAVSNLLLFKFPYKFVDAETLAADPQPFYRLRDDTLKTEYCQRRETQDAYLWLVLEAWRDGPVVPCAEVTADTQEYRADIGDDAVLMRRHFTITKRREDVVTVSQLKAFVFGKDMTVTVLKDRLRRMGAQEDMNCCVNGERLGRGFLGVRYTPDCEAL